MTKFIFLFALPLCLSAQFSARFPITTSCNVVGDRITDDTAAIQACVDAAPDDSEIVFPSGLQMKITATININGRYGLRLRGQTAVFGGPSAGTPAPTLYWYGPDGGTMMSLDRTDNTLIEGLAFFTSAGYVGGVGGANIGILVDKTLPSGGTSTNDRFERVSIVSGTANPNFRGIVFADASSNNVEAMTVRDSVILCSYSARVGQGIVIGAGGFYNAKKHVYQNNRISSCATGIYLTGGSADIVDNKFNLTVTDIYANPIDPIRIVGNDSENSTQFFTGPLTSPITMSDNRISSTSPPAGQGSVWITSGGSQVLTFQGNKFDDGAFIPVAFDRNVGGSLDSSGNTYPSGGLTLQGFYTVPYTLTSRNETSVSVLTKVDGVSAPGFLMGGGYYHHIGGLVYDDDSKRWKMSDEISDPTVSTGHMVVTEPAPSLTVSGSTVGLGNCGAGTDLVSGGNGAGVTSATISFVNADAGGYIHVNPGSGWTGGDYYIISAPDRGAAISDSVPSNLTGGSFTVNRGRHMFLQGAPGQADTYWVCAKDASDNYAWKQVFWNEGPPLFSQVASFELDGDSPETGVCVQMSADERFGKEFRNVSEEILTYVAPYEFPQITHCALMGRDEIKFAATVKKILSVPYTPLTFEIGY